MTNTSQHICSTCKNPENAQLDIRLVNARRGYQLPEPEHCASCGQVPPERNTEDIASLYEECARTLHNVLGHSTHWNFEECEIERCFQAKTAIESAKASNQNEVKHEN